MKTNFSIMTVKQFSAAYPAFTESSLRYLIFQATPSNSSRGVKPGNGLEIALRRIGRRVYIVPEAFFEWVDRSNGVAREAA